MINPEIKDNKEDVDTNIGDSSQKMGVGDMSFMFDIVFKRMYRDPIGSIVREITSNCFDAHLEAGVLDKPVVIEFGEEEELFISFTDVGIGISPERMEKVYKNAGVSSKRDSKEAIGYWGLGSKSPLAYTDNFFLTTTYDHIRYDYLIFKANSPIPEIQLLDKEEVEDGNGSTVKIVIKNNNDLEKFQEACNKQLRYFDNVYVKGYEEFNNNYTIYEGKTFKFRDDIRLGSDLHLSIGKVYYPISWELLGREPIKLPFGLKVDIGEVPITPERESVSYITIEKEGKEVTVVDVINAKIKALFEEIQEKVDSINNEHNNLIEWFEADNKEKSITIGDKDIKLPHHIKKKSAIYTPFLEIGIKDTPATYPFTGLKITKKYSGIHKKLMSHELEIQVEDLRDRFLVRVLSPISRFRSMHLDYLQSLAEAENKCLYIIQKTPYQAKVVKPKISTALPNIKRRDFSKVNLLSLWKKYLAIMHKELILNSVSYFDVEVPKEFETRWKLKNKKTVDTIEVEEGEILVEDIRNAVKTYRRKTISLSELNPNIPIIYGSTKEEDLLEKWSSLFCTGFYASPNNLLIIRIKKADEKYLIHLKQTINVLSMMSPNPMFIKVATAAVVQKSKIWNYRFDSSRNTSGETSTDSKVLGLIFTPLQEKLDNLREIKDNTVNINNNSAETLQFVEEVVKLAEDNQWIEDQTKKDIAKVEKYFDGLDLINYIIPDKKAIKHIAQYFNKFGKPVNREWIELEGWQREIMEEARVKATYVADLGTYSSYRRLQYGTRRDKVEKAENINKANFQKMKESLETYSILN